jgi:hypothetical protein
VKKSGIFIGLLLWGAVAGVEAQQTATDSLQKRFSQLSKAMDTLHLDTLKKAQAVKLKDSVAKEVTKKPIPKLNPRKAAYYSLMLPGLGQAYNRQYWKMPFVYAGLGTVVYFIRYFNIRYQDFLQPYIESYDPTSGKQLRTEAEVYLRNLKQTRLLTVAKITQGKDIYRRYRDLNIVLLAGVWALAAVEANVAAHLITFDMSEDISLRLQPDAQYNSFTRGVVGAKAVFIIK